MTLRIIYFEMTDRKTPGLTLLSILVIVLIASNLRSPITSVGPVLGEISEQLKLNNFLSSMLTSIPLMVFAGLSVLVSRISQRWDITRFLFFALIILSAGLVLRVYGSISTLLLGSVLIGLGICIGNVITPGYIKNNFPKNIGLLTGIFAVSMNLTAALASGYSISIGQWTGMGWQGSLGIWLIITLLACVVIGVELIFNRRKKPPIKVDIVNSGFAIFKSSQAWNISIFMGLQSVVYYSLISWLPSVLTDYGMVDDEPGWILFIIQMAMLPITFLGPIVANRMKDQKMLILIACVLMLLSILMFAWLKTDYIYVSAILLGLSNGLSFSLCILLFSLRTKSSKNAIKISGMAQSIGYFIAAFGPPIFGKLHDWDGSWQSSFYFVAFVIVFMFYFGLKAGTNKYIED